MNTASTSNKKKKRGKRARGREDQMYSVNIY